MFNPFAKKTQADAKAKKKYLSDSLIGPGPIPTPQADFGQNDLMSQVNKPAPTFKNPFESPAKSSMASSNSDSTESTSKRTEASSQKDEVIPKRPEASEKKEEDGNQSNNLLKFIQGNYFSKGPGQGNANVAKSFAFGSNQPREFDKDLPLSRGDSTPSHNVDKPTVTARHQRIGSLEIEIKETVPFNDSGLVYDLVLHHSEVGSRSGAKMKGKIFINNYLDMENLITDDLSHYSREMNKDIEIASPSKSIHLQRKKDSFEVKKFKGEVEAEVSISTDPNQSILENLSVSMNYCGPQSALDKETMDLLENFDLDEEDSENKKKKQQQQNRSVPASPLKLPVEVKEPPKIYENSAQTMQPDVSTKNELSVGKLFEKKSVKHQPHSKVNKSKKAQKIQKEGEEKPAEAEAEAEANLEVENNEPENEEVIEQKEDETQEIENIKQEEEEEEAQPIKINVRQPAEEPEASSLSPSEEKDRSQSKSSNLEEMIPRSQSSEATKPITPRLNSLNSQISGGGEGKVSQNKDVSVELDTEAEAEADLLDEKSNKADSVSLDSLSDNSSRRGSIAEDSSLKDVAQEGEETPRSPRSPTKTAKKEEDSEQNLDLYLSPDSKEIKNRNNNTPLKGSFSETSSKAVQNKYIAQQGDYQDEDLKIDQTKKGTIRVLSAYDSQTTGKSSKFTLEKAIARSAQKNKESLTDVSAKTEAATEVSRTESNFSATSSSSKDKEKINVPRDPIDAFDKEDEAEVVEDAHMDLKDFMIVTQNPLVSSYKLNITSIVPIKSVTEEVYPTEARKTRKYEATLIKFAPPNYIFVGTTASTVLIFDHEEKLVKALKYSDGPQQTVTALDFFVDETDTPTIVVGFSGGHIAGFELKTFTLLKAVTAVQTQKITSIKVLKADPLLFVASDESGQVVRYQVQKMLWFWAEEHRVLVANEAMTFDIQGLAKEMRARSSESLAEELDLRYVFALAKFEKIVIIDARDSVSTEAAKVLYSFFKPAYITESHLPSVSWGNASFHQFTRKTFLAIGWGSIVHLIKFAFPNSKPEFDYVGHFVMNWTIIRTVTWVNESTLAVMDQDDVLYFIQSEDFTEGEYKHEGGVPELPDSPERKLTVEEQKVYTYLLADKLRAKLSFVDSKKNQKPFWGSALSTSYKTHEIVILGEKGVYKVRPMNALEYLEKLCLDNEWLKFLTVALQVYHKNIKEFTVPTDKRKRREVLVPFFREKVQAYLENQFKKEGESQEFYKEFMLSLIDFFTEIEDTEFLFIICQRKMTEFGLQEIFLEMLEPFLINDRIKYIPDGQLKSVIIYYCGKGKRQLMQKLLLGLDLEKQDCFVLLHLCLEYNFYKALVDICTKVDDNYITPFVKLTSDYQFAKGQGREEEARDYGYRCLWYLKLCINKKLVSKSDSAEKQHERWKNIIFQLMVMIFEPKNLQMLFEVDGELTICLMLLFFVGDLAELVEEKYGDFFIGQKTNDANIDDIHFQVYQALKNGLKDWANDLERDKYLQNFGFFHGKVAQLLRYAFLDRVLCVDFVKRFINEPALITDSILLSWEKSRLEYEGKSVEEIQQYFDSKVTAQFIHAQRTSIILDLLKYCQFTLSETEINNLVDKARDSSLIEIESTLLTMKAAYKECLELYLSPRAPQYYKENVFSWIVQTFRMYIDKPDKTDTEKHGIEELKLALVEKLPLLVSLDREISKALINEFLGEKMSQVLRKIRLDPTLQLEVLEKFLSKYDENKKIDSEYLILHIHLLAMNHKKGRKRVKDVLQRSNRYPLDACLDICQDNDIKDAWAYLELKRGDVAKAIEIIYIDFEETVQKYLDKKDFVYKNKKDKVFKKITVLLDYLSQLHKSPEKLWFDMLIKIYTLIEEKTAEIPQEGETEARRRELEEMKKDIIDQMLDNIVGTFDSKDVLRVLNDKTQNIPETLKGKILTKVILHNAHENFILENCQSLVREDILMFHNIQLYPYAIKGTYHIPSCQSCLKNFVRSDSLLWFGCGHIFHASESCCSKGKCPICQTSIPTLIARFVSVRGPNMRMMNKQGEVVENPLGSSKKAEELVKTSKETKADKLKYKMNRMQEFNKYKVKKQKEWNKFLEKYM